jgi:signal transduction histidine kinase
MIFLNGRNRWVPALVAVIGVGLSILWARELYINDAATYTIIDFLGPYLHWVALVFGFTITYILVSMLRYIRLVNSHSDEVDRINENLKREINERVFAEENTQKLEIALLQGQKLQAIGTLAGGIAHDFNNILYAIIGYAEMAREDVEKDSQIYRNLGKVLEGSQRGQELVSRILSFSRRQHHEFSELDLSQAIESALSLLRPAIPASVTLDFKPMPDIKIDGNQTQLHQVLVNIINNAVDAMDGDGTITIELSRVPANDPLLRQFPGMKAPEYCKIEIADTGHGMDKQAMERIFEPFYTTKEVGKGTGLGLSIVHSIIKEHKGEVTLTSQLGHGTKFMILLPIYIGEGT